MPGKSDPRFSGGHSWTLWIRLVDLKDLRLRDQTGTLLHPDLQELHRQVKQEICTSSGEMPGTTDRKTRRGAT